MSSDPEERESGTVLDYPDPTFICEFCGREIEEQGQRCPALDDGRCFP